MHVLMLGWEFPPFIAGGLGTACHGLTKAMDRQGLGVTFVLPKAIDRSQSSHVNLLSPEGAAQGGAAFIHTVAAHRAGEAESSATAMSGATAAEPAAAEPFRRVRFIGIPSRLSNPYQRSLGEGPAGRWTIDRAGANLSNLSELSDEELAGVEYEVLQASAPGGQSGRPQSIAPPAGSDYSGDLLAEVHRFARFCAQAARQLKFDVVHAHDWMTYPAGLMISQLTGKPLVVHVHSTEFDRSGLHVNQRVYDIERRGMHGAMRVITVSQLTKNVVVSRYGVRESQVEVVYNGVELEPGSVGITGIQTKDKIVLYFGRITYQKGPEYFIAAAKRVLDVMDDVKFVVAGSGDQAKGMIEMAAGLGIGHKVLFTGFLRGKDIQRVFALADLYVMPSVSEPFGIAPLEAMAHDVPAIISKSSGVSEVLTNVLKVDFWDIDDMANKIVAVLRHPPLSNTLREHGAFEVRKLTWDGAANRCTQVYQQVVGEMKGRRAARV